MLEKIQKLRNPLGLNSPFLALLKCFSILVPPSVCMQTPKFLKSERQKKKRRTTHRVTLEEQTSALCISTAHASHSAKQVSQRTASLFVVIVHWVDLRCFELFYVHFRQLKRSGKQTLSTQLNRKNKLRETNTLGLIKKRQTPGNKHSRLLIRQTPGNRHSHLT